MAEELQGLLNRINEEGVKKAEAEKQRIIDEARAEARNIVEKAAAEAAAMKQAAEKANSDLKLRSESAIRQAARDVILALKAELERRLSQAISAKCNETMTPQFMADMIKELAEKFATSPDSELEIRTAVKDTAKLDEVLRGTLTESYRNNPKIISDANISGGFEVSFKNGDLYFDFTTDAVAELVGEYAGPKLAELIK